MFGYDYLKDRIGPDRFAALALNSHEGERGGSVEYALELLNFLAAGRSVDELTNLLSAEFGPIPPGHVTEYLGALREAGVAAGPGDRCGD